MTNDFGPGGAALWQAVTEAHELDETQRVQLVEACRMKDRLDKMDELLRGNIAAWATIEHYEGNTSVLVISSVLDKANATANAMKQLIAAMRLPDAAGKRPQYRGPRGAQAPSTPGGKSSAAGRAASRWGS